MLALAYAQEESFLATLERLVCTESPSTDPAALHRFAELLTGLLERDGWGVTTHQRPDVGPHLEARLGGPAGTSTLILAHYDTVWPVGTLAEMPWRRDGDAVFGPGVLDMKSGLALALHAPRLARAAGRALRGPVTLLVTSDEETGSGTSRSLIERLAAEHDRVLVVEPARDDGALKIGRKGVAGYRAEFHGVSAHAGNDPEAGASALRELAHFLLHAEGQARPEVGTTVNVTVASGGSTSNVIAERATARLDVRVPTSAESDRVGEALRSYAPRDPRVRVSVSGGLNRPPLEQTPANRALWEEARAAGAALGLDLAGAAVGGGSDGSFASAVGTATLDGLGGVGAGPHARHEQIRLRETLGRLALLTALLT